MWFHVKWSCGFFRLCEYETGYTSFSWSSTATPSLFLESFLKYRQTDGQTAGMRTHLKKINFELNNYKQRTFMPVLAFSLHNSYRIRKDFATITEVKFCACSQQAQSSLHRHNWFLLI